MNVISCRILTLSLCAAAFAAVVFFGFSFSAGYAQAQTVEELQAQVQSLLKQVETLQAQIEAARSDETAAGGGVSADAFNRNLTVGSRGDNVRKLQQFLNQDPETRVAQSGAGSPGNETTYFGPRTADAVRRFQEKHREEVLAPIGLARGTGYFGPRTRAHAKTLVGGDKGKPPTQEPTVPREGPGYTIQSATSGSPFLVVPKNASNAAFGTFRITAGVREVRITGVTVERAGLGDRDDFDDVWLTVDGAKWGRERSLDADDQAVFSFPDRPIVIPAGKNKSLTIRASLSERAVAGHYSQFRIAEIKTETVSAGEKAPSREVSAVQGALVIEELLSMERETVVAGAGRATLIRFRAQAGAARDIIVESVSFELSDESTFKASNVKDLTLLANGNRLGSLASLSGGTFSGLDYVIPAQAAVTFELRGSLEGVISDKSLLVNLIGIAAHTPEGGTVWVTRRGTALGRGNPLASPQFSVTTSGIPTQFTVSIHGDTPDGGTLVADGGELWQPVARYRLHAEGGTAKLTDLYLINAPSSSLTAASTEADDRVISLGLFDENGALKGMRSLSSGRVHFDLGSGINPGGQGAVVVPRDETTAITIRARLNEVNDLGDTGKRIRLVLDTTEGKGDTGIVAEDTEAGAEVLGSAIVAARDGGGGAIRASETASDVFVIRNTKPLFTLVPQDTGDRILIGGSNEVIYRFTLRAHNDNELSWKGIKFDLIGAVGGNPLATTTGSSTFQTGGVNSSIGFGVTSSSAHVNRFTLYDRDQNQPVANGRFKVHVDWDDANGNGEVAFILEDLEEEVLEAGEEKTYEVRANIGGLTGSTDFISVSLDEETDDARTDTSVLAGTDPDEVDGTADAAIRMTATSAVNPYVFLWSDNSGLPHSAETNNENVNERDWTNDGYLTIPTSPWTRSR